MKSETDRLPLPTPGKGEIEKKRPLQIVASSTVRDLQRERGEGKERILCPVLFEDQQKVLYSTSKSTDQRYNVSGTTTYLYMYRISLGELEKGAVGD